LAVARPWLRRGEAGTPRRAPSMLAPRVAECGARETGRWNCVKGKMQGNECRCRHPACK
jgi:hypothetical protein